MTAEEAEVVVVGARCAGSAAAIALARVGRQVVVLDRVRFPADTISTHLLFTAGVSELRALGAYERVRALGAPPLREASVAGAGLYAQAPFAVMEDGTDHAWCVRRPGLDTALVETARAAGAEVREGVRVTGVLREGGRVRGVRYEDRDGGSGEIRAPLVIGADGRRSTVAREVGAQAPYRSSANGRACFYAYYEDAREDLRGVASQWRDGRELGTTFPCDGGLTLVLLMPPVERADDFRGDLEGEFLRTVARMDGLRGRLDGSTIASKVRSALDTTSYFRRSAGRGWALAGDAGHFKDPVTAQGIRDAMRYGRLLGEAVGPVLERPARLDRAVLAWERRRERECLEVYQWTNVLARAEAMTALEVELYRQLARDPALTTQLLSVFGRTRAPSRVLAPGRVLGLAARALARPGADRRAVLRVVARDGRGALSDARDRAWAARARARWAPAPLLPPPSLRRKASDGPPSPQPMVRGG